MEMGFRWDFAYEILPQMLLATLNTIIAAGFTLYFDPSNNDNLTMRDLSINSSDNTRSIGSSVASGLVMTY